MTDCETCKYRLGGPLCNNSMNCKLCKMRYVEKLPRCKCVNQDCEVCPYYEKDTTEAQNDAQNI